MSALSPTLVSVPCQAGNYTLTSTVALSTLELGWWDQSDRRYYNESWYWENMILWTKTVLSTTYDGFIQSWKSYVWRYLRVFIKVTKRKKSIDSFHESHRVLEKALVRMRTRPKIFSPRSTQLFFVVDKLSTTGFNDNFILSMQVFMWLSFIVVLS